MEILVDDQPYQATGDSDQTVAELADEVSQASGPTPSRMVVGLRCDGQPVDDTQLEEILHAPARRFTRLEFETQSTTGLVRVTLDQTIGMFESSGPALQRAADLLDEGKQEEAMQAMQGFCELWRQGQQAVLLAAQALEVDLDHLMIDGRDTAAILEPIKTQLNALKDAMETGDLVLVGDVLRYELEEPLAGWIALMQRLRDAASTASES